MFVRRSLFWFVMVAMIGALGTVLLASAFAMIWGLKRSSADLTPQSYTDTREHQSAICPTNASVVVTFGQSLAANSHEHIYRKAPNRNV
jgi:hypothetical protein